MLVHDGVSFVDIVHMVLAPRGVMEFSEACSDAVRYGFIVYHAITTNFEWASVHVDLSGVLVLVF